jgi:hypothetical protein
MLPHAAAVTWDDVRLQVWYGRLLCLQVHHEQYSVRQNACFGCHDTGPQLDELLVAGISVTIYWILKQRQHMQANKLSHAVPGVPNLTHGWTQS